MVLSKVQKGIPIESVKVVGKTDLSRDSYPFLSGFGNIRHELIFSFDVLSKRLRELAFLNKGIEISLEDKRDNQEKIRNL